MTSHIYKGRHTLPIVVAGVFVMAFGLLPSVAHAAGSIWTTKGDCGDISQDVNHYNVGDHVYINGSGFRGLHKYNWNIKGLPGSSDPNQTVASGQEWTNLYGKFCFYAYTVHQGDSGEYHATFDNKHDNYQVDANYCGDGKVNQESEQCDGEKGCAEDCTWNLATIHVSKVICDSESDLPNSGTDSHLKSITASTASDYVLDSFNHCRLADWTFQWRPDNGLKPGDPDYNPGDNSGVGGGIWSSAFSDSVDVPVNLNKVWLREVWNSDYIPFTYNVVGNNSNDESAEFYCNDDVLNYDNLEWVNLDPGQDYYCVGFNTLAFQPAKVEVCKEIDYDGINEGDDKTAMPGWEMYLQTNTGDPIATQTTGDDGCTTFTITEPGAYKVVEENRTGYTSLNGDTFWLGQVQSGEQNYKNIFVNYKEPVCGDSVVDYGEECDGSSYCTDKCVQQYFLDGYKWNDLNGDSRKTADEPLMGGWTIFLDENDNGILDNEEMNDVTDTGGDYNGHYCFENLPAGDYTVCEVLKDGWTQTYPADPVCHEVTLSGPFGPGLPQPNFGNMEIPTYDVHGFKWNDLNGDGIRNCSVTDISADFSMTVANINGALPLPRPECEPLLCDWTIQLKQNDTVIDETKTSCDDNPDYGWYWFQGLTAGTYEICEVQQPGWTQTYPENCHEVTLPLTKELRALTEISDNYVEQAPEFDFGNMGVAPICGDGIVNQETEQCDGTAGITGDQTCSNDCMIVNPATPVITFTLAKTVDKATANPGDTLTYTVKVTNTGNTAATNVTLTDTLPTGLTYLDADGNNTGDTTKTWTWPTLAAGASETVTYKTHVDSSATAKAYVNTATVKADGVDPVSAQATTTVTIPTVLGEEVATLTITKTVAEPTVNPGGTLNFTVVVTNTGTTPANNVVLTDTLPQGMVFADNNTTTHSWNLGDLVPTESVTTTYAVKVDAGIIPGKYVNTASAKADDVASVTAQAKVEVIAGQVLGEETDIVPTITTLPSTGADILPSLIAGLSLLGSGFILAKRGKK